MQSLALYWFRLVITAQVYVSQNEHPDFNFCSRIDNVMLSQLNSPFCRYSLWTAPTFHFLSLHRGEKILDCYCIAAQWSSWSYFSQSRLKNFTYNCPKQKTKFLHEVWSYYMDYQQKRRLLALYTSSLPTSESTLWRAHYLHFLSAHNPVPNGRACIHCGKYGRPWRSVGRRGIFLSFRHLTILWTLRNSVLSSQTSATTLLKWPCQEQCRSGLPAIAPVSGVSALGCTNGVWPPLRPVSMAQNKPSAMLSFNILSNPSTSPWTAWPDGCGRWDKRMAAQHLFRDLVQPSSGLKNWLKRRRRICTPLFFFSSTWNEA